MAFIFCGFSYYLSYFYFSVVHLWVFACTYVCAPRLCPVPTTGVTDSYEPTYKCWESSLGPWEEQHMLLTTEPSLSSWPLF